MTIDVGTLMRNADQILPRALDRYKAHINTDGFYFHEPNSFQMTPNKGYTANSTVQLRYKDNNVGNLVVVMFAPGDATGNNKDYKESDLCIPTWARNSSRGIQSLIPRKKRIEDVHAEYFFPFFSLDAQNHYDDAVYLEELTLRNIKKESPALSIGARLGFPSKDSLYAYVRGEKPIVPPIPLIQYTVGQRNGKRLGNPHAIWFNPSKAPEDLVQVVGFLTIKDPNDPLIELIDPLSSWPHWDTSNLVQ